MFLAEFSLRLVCGMCLLLGVMPRREVTHSFFRDQMWILLGLAVFAFLTLPAPSTGAVTPLLVPGLVIAASVSAFLGSISWAVNSRRMGGLWIAVIGMCALGGLVLNSASLTALQVADVLAGSGVLGGAMIGMLLGHSYLTAPGMSLVPLERVNTWFGGTVLLRGALSGASLAMHFPDSLATTHLLWLLLRWVAGLIGPAVIAVMCWRILKYRNTQAATGVLFVAVILTFIGELLAGLLSRELGVPV